jgi:hypothetical protein
LETLFFISHPNSHPRFPSASEGETVGTRP